MISTFDLTLLGSLIVFGGLVFLQHRNWPHFGRIWLSGRRSFHADSTPEGREKLERSAVMALAQPLRSVPPSSGVNQAPSLIATTPGAMRPVTLAGSTVAPWALKMRTSWPSLMPRGFASAGLIHTSSGSTRARPGWLPWIECVRARDLGLHRLSG